MSWSIKRGVLREFRKLTPEAVWDRYDLSWNARVEGLDPEEARLTLDSMTIEAAEAYVKRRGQR